MHFYTVLLLLLLTEKTRLHISPLLLTSISQRYEIVTPGGLILPSQLIEFAVTRTTIDSRGSLSLHIPLQVK